MCVLILSVMSDSLRPRDCSMLGDSVHGIFPSKDSGVGCHFFLQENFQIQESNLPLLYLLHWQVDSVPLSHPGSPYVLCHAKLLPTCLTLCDPSVTPAWQVPLPMWYSKQENWSGLPCPPDPEVQIASLTSPALAGEFFTASVTWEAQAHTYMQTIWRWR